MAGAVVLLPAVLFDGVDEQGRQYFSPDRRRVLDTDERQRLVAYLTGAPVAVASAVGQPDELDASRPTVVPSGYRTDGVWLWPEALAYYLGTYGIAPERLLLASIERAGYTPPSQVSPEVLAAASRLLTQPSVRQPPPAPRRGLNYLAWAGPGSTADDPDGLLRRWTQPWPGGADATIVEAVGYDLRWHATGLLRDRAGGRGEVVQIPARRAADVLDRWLAAGGVPAGAAKPVRLAVSSVFDAADGSGQPYFSPDRRRVPDPAERQRLLAYLSGAPLAMRAHGLEPDPLDPARRAAVPVGYRTDGVWVWQEAAEYYLRTRGVAPEDDLVAHIERAGYTPPAQVPIEVLYAAADAALLPGADPPGGRRPARYYSVVRSSGALSGVYRQWLDEDGYRIDEVCAPDLRWRSTGAFVQNAYSGEKDFVEISARRAAEILDERLARWS